MSLQLAMAAFTAAVLAPAATGQVRSGKVGTFTAAGLLNIPGGIIDPASAGPPTPPAAASSATLPPLPVLPALSPSPAPPVPPEVFELPEPQAASQIAAITSGMRTCTSDGGGEP